VAAKTFDEWYSEVAKIDGEVSFRMCWKAATDAAEERFTYAQHTQPAICAWLKANDMCSKWGSAGAKVCIACEAPRKQQASAVNVIRNKLATN